VFTDKSQDVRELADNYSVREGNGSKPIGETRRLEESLKQHKQEFSERASSLLVREIVCSRIIGHRYSSWHYAYCILPPYIATKLVNIIDSLFILYISSRSQYSDNVNKI
jgi:hypothetical protein